MSPATATLTPMLARLEPEMPRGPGWLYEPKWDGFRALVFREGRQVRLQSRAGQPLDRYFPELLPELVRALPPGVYDGEIVLQREGALDFEALLQRLHPARSRIERLARETPCSFAAFDVLALGGEDLKCRPFKARRRLLERALEASAAVFPTPQTGRIDVARRWFEELEARGIEGVVAKRADGPYLPGERAMVKVKHARTADCVVGGYRAHGSRGGVGTLLLGVFDAGGGLVHLGHTSQLGAPERRRAGEVLGPLETAENPFREDRSPGGPSRWSRGRSLEWTPLRPEAVVEVGYDALMGGRFRHAARFLRFRDDKRPAECTEASLARERGPPHAPAPSPFPERG